MNVEEGLSTYDTWLFYKEQNGILHNILKKNCKRMNKTVTTGWQKVYK
jgi:hypothetical protein